MYKKLILKFTEFGFIWLLISLSIFAQTEQNCNCAEEKARLEKAERSLKDWANLGRYKEANSKVLLPAKNENRVVFIGDSITDNWKINEDFPDLLYINRGIGSQTTPQILLRFRPDVVLLKPKVVVILAGTNDIAGLTGPTMLETIENNLLTMVEIAHANNINVVLSSVLPVSDYHKDKEGKQLIRTIVRPPDQILQLNKWIKNYSAQKDLVFLDYFSAMVDDKGFFKEELSRDGVHPNIKGYEVMKSLVEKAIATALENKQRK